MKKWQSTIKRLVVEEEGATAVEYGLMVGAIAALIVVTVVAVGDKVLSAFETLDTAMSAEPFGGTGGSQ